jgi:hypothetical protein
MNGAPEDAALRIARELGDKPMIGKLLGQRSLRQARPRHDLYDLLAGSGEKRAWREGFTVGALAGFVSGLLAVAVPAIILAAFVL